VVARMTVTGTEEVVAAFDALERDVDDLTETHRRVVTRLIPDVAIRTPRRTGALAVSWQPGASKVGGSIESPLEHAAPIEFGTSRGVPEFRPVRGAIEAREGDIGKAYEDSIAASATRLGFRGDRS